MRLSIFSLAALLLCVTPIANGQSNVTSSDGLFQVTVPANWEKTQLPKSKAKLSVKNPETMGFVSVLAEPKADFDVSIKDYAKLCMDNSAKITKLKDRVVDGPADVKVNDKPAVQYRETGSMNGIKFVFTFTFYEGDTFFLQVMCWSTPSAFDRNKKDFEFITAHVVELPANKQ